MTNTSASTGSGADADRRHQRLPGSQRLDELQADDWARIAELTDKYADHPLGGIDASLVALAERLNIDTIATLDHRHFHAVRPKHVEAFTLVP